MKYMLAALLLLSPTANAQSWEYEVETDPITLKQTPYAIVHLSDIPESYAVAACKEEVVFFTFPKYLGLKGAAKLEYRIGEKYGVLQGVVSGSFSHDFGIVGRDAQKLKSLMSASDGEMVIRARGEIMTMPLDGFNEAYSQCSE